MTTGQTVGDDQALEQMGQGHSETMAELREIEVEAFTATNRVEALRQEAGVTVETADSQMKSKIINRLAGDSNAESQESKVSAEAAAQAKAKS